MAELNELNQEPEAGAAPAGMDALDVLAHQAEALEGSTTGPQEEAQAAQELAEVTTAAAELLAALEMLRLMAAPLMDWWPLFEKVWSDRQLQAISTAGAAVMQRQGWTMGELMAQWGPYIALVGAVLPPSLVTYQAVKQRQEEAQKPQQRPAAPAPAPVVHPTAGERL